MTNHAAPHPILRYLASYNPATRSGVLGTTTYVMGETLFHEVSPNVLVLHDPYDSTEYPEPRRHGQKVWLCGVEIVPSTRFLGGFKEDPYFRIYLGDYLLFTAAWEWIWARGGYWLAAPVELNGRRVMIDCSVPGHAVCHYLKEQV